MHILFKYTDDKNLPRVAKRHCSVVPEVNDIVWIITADEVEHVYAVVEREWSFYAHPSVDEDISVTVILTNQRYNLNQRTRERYTNAY